jgi:hypothetical protein
VSNSSRPHHHRGANQVVWRDSQGHDGSKRRREREGGRENLEDAPQNLGRGGDLLEPPARTWSC